MGEREEREGGERGRREKEGPRRGNRKRYIGEGPKEREKGRERENDGEKL